MTANPSRLFHLTKGTLAPRRMLFLFGRSGLHVSKPIPFLDCRGSHRRIE